MNDGQSNVVVGIFSSRQQSMAVEHDLRRIGLGDQDINVGPPAPGPYQQDVREAESLGRGVLDGIVIGTILGALIGALLVVVAVPGALEHGASAILLGILMGGFWGSFFGGLGGMAIRAAASEEARWCEVPDRSSAVLVIARAGAQAEAVRTAMLRGGASALLKAKPDMIAAESPVAAPQTVPAGPGDLSLGAPLRGLETVGAGTASSATWPGDDRSAHLAVQAPHQSDQAPAISIPRGAFLLLVLFLIACSALWANVYLRVLWRA
jgi:hypothetical protein